MRKEKKLTRIKKCIIAGLTSVVLVGTVAQAGTFKFTQIKDDFNYFYFPILGDTNDDSIDSISAMHGYKNDNFNQLDVKVNAMYDKDGNWKGNWSKTHWQVNLYTKKGVEHLSNITTVKKSSEFKKIYLKRKVGASEAIWIQAEGNSTASAQISGTVKDTTFWYASGLK